MNQDFGIEAIYSGACVELSHSLPDGDFTTFEKTKDGLIDSELVFVIVARVSPTAVAVFCEEVVENLLVACDERELILSLKPEGYIRWFQFRFEQEAEYWDFVHLVFQAKKNCVVRREAVTERIHRLAHDFPEYFKPTTHPYDDPETIAELRCMDEESDDDEDTCLHQCCGLKQRHVDL
ncbi:hypothetical protein BV20DRAFT_1054669 [Pilatotrama ljubarskyi]|nr:hypothetical protein BV20DRAFT_1054669 [Pilatotrama ljubarskyi]